MMSDEDMCLVNRAKLRRLMNKLVYDSAKFMSTKRGSPEEHEARLKLQRSEGLLRKYLGELKPLHVWLKEKG